MDSNELKVNNNRKVENLSLQGKTNPTEVRMPPSARIPCYGMD